MGKSLDSLANVCDCGAAYDVRIHVQNLLRGLQCTFIG